MSMHPLSYEKNTDYAGKESDSRKMAFSKEQPHKDHNYEKKRYEAYVEAYERLVLNEKESWYDTIYDQRLMLLVLLEEEKRKAKTEEFMKQLEKNNMNGFRPNDSVL